MRTWTIRLAAPALGLLLLGGGAVAAGTMTGSPHGQSARVAYQASPAGTPGCAAEDRDQTTNDTPQAQDQAQADATEQAEAGSPTAEQDQQCESPAPGTLDEGKDLLPQAKITVAQAVKAAQAKVSGPLGGVDLEKVSGRLVFRVEIGDKDVQVDAANGTVVAVSAETHNDHQDSGD